MLFEQKNNQILFFIFACPNYQQIHVQIIQGNIYIISINIAFQIIYAMKIWILILLFLSISLGDDQTLDMNKPIMTVGQIVPGKIDPAVKNQQIHPIKIDKLQSKYLFIRLSTFDTNLAAIGLYSHQQNGGLLFSCMDNTYDTCYIPSKMLKPDTPYIILVMSNLPINYNLYTYWGQIEHLKPDHDIKFMFDPKDKSQLFHLELEDENFQQIRIVLRPQTSRAEGDSLKIFANVGLKQEPTQEKHQFQSIHVWNDAQAIFLTKEDLKGEKGVLIYIVGNAKTVYILSCQIIKQKIHNINMDEVLYEYVNRHQESLYHMKFGQADDIDVHVIRFSVFTGQVQVGFFYDQQMKKFFKKLPFQYMSDIQFHILKSDLEKGTKDLYMRIRSRDTASTFQLNMQGRKNLQSFQMYENVFQFVPIRQAKQGMFFYSHIWDESQYDRQKIHMFDISVIKVQGDPVVSFYLCKPSSFSEDICKQSDHQDFNKNIIKIEPSGKSQVGSKLIYTIQVDQKLYKNINSVESRALIFIELSSIGNKNAFAAVQFSNPSKVRLLREGRAFEDKVSLSSTKYYKYQNSNPNIATIKIHIYQISGLTKIFAKRGDTRWGDGKQIKMSTKQPNNIVVTQNITEPIFIQIFGIVASIYTISVDPVHKEHPLSSSLILAQDIQYSLKLLPFDHTNIQIHPIEEEVIFQFNVEGGSIVVCEINLNDLCKNGTEIIGNNAQIKVDSSSARQIRLRLGNYVNSTSLPKGDKSPAEANKSPAFEFVRAVKVKVRYHAVGKKHCQIKSVNQVYSQLVKSGSCFKFHLPLEADIQILFSRQNLAQGQHYFFLCQNKVKSTQFLNNRYRIPKNLIAENCKKFPNDIVLNIVIIDSTAHENDPNQLRIDYSVEYLNDIITLADGVAYYSKTTSLQQQIKTFFYEIVDEESPIQIVLFNKKGIQKFLAKVVNKKNKYYSKVNEAIASISSKDAGFYSNPTAQIKKQHITKSKCDRDCLLIVSVYSKEKPGSEIQFGIQVTQHEITLRQNQIRSDFLSMGSVKYYQYNTRKSPTDLLFKVSDNNRKCAKSYLSVHPFPSMNNYIAYENEGSLTYRKAEKGIYYFAVQAVQDCPFTISVSEGENKITKIQYGQYYDIKLNEEQEAWFYLRHLSKSSFKIVTLLKHGFVNIFVNKTELSMDTINSVSNGTLKSDNFKFKNEYQNSLTISQKSDSFCFNCYYLVNIKAKYITEGSIFLGSQNSKIELSPGKTLFDQIKQQNETTLAIFYKVSEGNILANVYSGRIKVVMTYEDQQFSKSFQKDKNVHNESYKFKRVQKKYQPIQIQVIALSVPAIYSLQIVPKSGDKSDSIKLNPGQSSLLLMQKGVQSCFVGTLRSKNQQILVIADSDQNINLNLVKITGKINQKQSKLITQHIGNIVSIKFEIIQTFFPNALPYSICLQSDNTNNQYSVSFSVIQLQSLNLIAPDTELMVRNQGIFAIHQNGYIVVDVFQCQGKAQIVYSSDIASLDKKTTHQLDIIGIPGQNHAIKIQSQQVLFLKVNTEIGTLLWMPLNQEKERGVGYFKYAIGKLSYSTQFNQINFIIGGVYKVKQTKTSVQSVRYTLFVSNSRQLLQKGVMCQMNPQNKMISVNINSSKVGEWQAPEILAAVQKKKFTDSFSSNQTLFFNVVADLTLLPPNEDKQHEHYRFVYFEQVVPAQLLRQNKIQNLDYKLLIALVAVGTIGVIGILCVIVRWVIPIFYKMRGRVVVDTMNEQRESDMEAPPSSDRNQMTTGTSQRIR